MYAFYMHHIRPQIDLSSGCFGGGVLDSAPMGRTYVPNPVAALSDNTFDSNKYQWHDSSSVVPPHHSRLFGTPLLGKYALVPSPSWLARCTWPMNSIDFMAELGPGRKGPLRPCLVPELDVSPVMSSTTTGSRVSSPHIGAKTYTEITVGELLPYFLGVSRRSPPHYG